MCGYVLGREVLAALEGLYVAEVSGGKYQDTQADKPWPLALLESGGGGLQRR